MQQYHQFVATSHTLTSYIASLSYYAQRTGNKYASEEFIPLVQQIDKQFQVADRCTRASSNGFRCANQACLASQQKSAGTAGNAPP